MQHFFFTLAAHLLRQKLKQFLQVPICSVCFKHRVIKGCCQFLNVDLQGYFHMCASCGVICGLHVMSVVLMSGACL